MAQHGPNIAPRWANMAQHRLQMGQHGPKMGEHGPNIDPRWANIAPRWANIGLFRRHFRNARPRQEQGFGEKMLRRDRAATLLATGESVSWGKSSSWPQNGSNGPRDASNMGLLHFRHTTRRPLGRAFLTNIAPDGRTWPQHRAQMGQHSRPKMGQPSTWS